MIFRSVVGMFLACSVLFPDSAGTVLADDSLQGTPTEQSALTAEKRIAAALQGNDTSALQHLLAPEWIVISTAGGRANRDDVIAAIKAGAFTRTQLVISNPRVRLYGNTALVTTHANTSGMLMHKPFSGVQECQTDVLYWTNNEWVSVLLHETKLAKPTNC